MGIKDSRERAWQDWTGSAHFDRGVDDPAGEDYWAYQPVGAGLRRFRLGRETVLAARDGRAVVLAGGLSRAGRLPRRRARQLGTSVSRHLGHRTRAGGAVRASG